MKLRLGLIGLGSRWHSIYQPSLRLMHERFKVNAVYHSVKAIARATAQEFQAEVCDGIQSLVHREDVDAVLILENDWYHTQAVRLACQAGKAVLCSSDIEMTELQAAQLLDVVGESGISMMTEFPRRFAPATLRLKELIATRLGKPQLVFCHRRIPCEAPQAGRLQTSRAVRMRREMIELIDWCAYVVGTNPDAVQGVEHAAAPQSANRSPVQSMESTNGDACADSLDYDYKSMSLFFSQANPAVAQISCGTYIPSNWNEAIGFRPPADIQVCCEHGLAFLDLPNTLVSFDEAGRHVESLEGELPIGQQMLTQFHRNVTSLVRRFSGSQDWFRAIKTYEQAMQAARSGRRAQLDWSQNGVSNQWQQVV